MKKLMLLSLLSLFIIASGCASNGNYQEYEAAKQFKYSHRSDELPTDKLVGGYFEWKCSGALKYQYLLYEDEQPACTGEYVGGCGFTGYRKAYVCDDDQYYIGHLEPGLGDEMVYGPFEME